MDEAIKHCTAGLGIWEWASNDRGGEPDVVMACCGDVPTLETLAAVDLLRRHLPELKVRVVNVVDLMTLQPPSEHPHGLSDRDFDALFTTDKPIIFAFHGYPWLIHRLTYRRHEPRQHPRPRLQGGGHDDDAVRHVRAERARPLPSGERRDRPRCRSLASRAAYAKQAIRDKLIEHQRVHQPPWRRHAGDQRLDMGRRRGVKNRQFDGGGQRLRQRRGQPDVDPTVAVQRMKA